MSFIQGLPDTFPAMFPPKGHTSNFDNPPTLKSNLIALNATFLALMIVFVSARLYVRISVIKHMGLDDYFIVLAALASLVHTVVMCYDIRFGYGRHLWDIRANTMTPQVIKDLISIAIIYPIVIIFIKLSISLLYIDIFGRSKPFRYLIWSFMAFCFCFYTAFMVIQIVSLIQCSNPFSLTPVCRNAGVTTVISGAINVFTDICLLIFPIPMVLRLNMSLKRKIGLLAIFGCGSAACIVSIVRLGLSISTLKDPDILYYAALTSQLTIVEINTGIIAASMVTLPKLLRSPLIKYFSGSQVWQKMTSRRRLSSKDSGSSGRPMTMPSPQLVTPTSGGKLSMSQISDRI